MSKIIIDTELLKEYDQYRQFKVQLEAFLMAVDGGTKDRLLYQNKAVQELDQ